ncbi:MAG: invasion associated locus B family protein [Pseudomonadota bacterium]
MSSLVKLASIALLLAFATQAQSQSTEAPAETEEPAPRADGLSTGQEESPVGETYVKSEHGDWDLRCIRAPEGQKEPCQLYQLLEDQNGQSVAEINLFPLPPEDQLEAGATIVTPLETLLTQQLRLSVDTGKAKVYPFTFCTQIGCFSRIGLTADDIASFKRGNEGKIVVVPMRAPDQQVQLSISLTGFTAAFDAAVAEAAE